MSLVPMMLSNWWENLDRPHSLLDQHFGLGLHPEQLRPSKYVVPGTQNFWPLLDSRPFNYIRPCGDLLRQGTAGSSVVEADKNQFKVALDVQQFRPDEINVKVVDNYVIVDAKHEEKRDEHGWISREFQRRYLIPDQCDVDQVTSSLSSDGILSIAVPRKHHPKTENERVIKIEHTGKPAIDHSLTKTEAAAKKTEAAAKKKSEKKISE